MKTSYKVPYGKEEISFEVPAEFGVTVIPSNSMTPIKDVSLETKNALLNPINSKKISELLNEESKVCIIVTDITRACPDKDILPPLIDEIQTKINPSSITLLVASGMHRVMNKEEKIKKFGQVIVQNYCIIDHNVNDHKNLISLGHTKNGTPIKISKFAYDADILISIGVVEPHQYAGYSGGYKTLSIGVAGDETISNTHSRLFIENQNTRIGNIEGNIFYDDVVEIGKKVGLNFIINVILNKNNKVVELKAGEPLATHKTLIKLAKQISEFQIKNTFDVAVCGVGFPKDTNIYQTSRAASYIFYLPRPIVRNGGYIIIPAICNEGAGKGIGEQRFFEMLNRMTLNEILYYSEKFKAGEQRAFMMANVLKSCNVIIMGSSVPEIVKSIKMIPAATMSEAFQIVTNDLGKDLKMILIPNVLSILPIIKSTQT